MPTLAERPVKAEAWFMGAGHKRLRHLQLEEIVEHRELVAGDKPGFGLVRVTYANGERIYMNHTTRALSADGVTVPAQDFVLR